MAEFSTLMASLNGAKDILKAMSDLRDTATIQSKVVELQAKILDAQAAAFEAHEKRAALVQQVGRLQDDVARLEAWTTEKERYELKELGNGTFAYAPKDGMRGPEPPHWICPRCYEDGRKSILQPETRFPGRIKVYTCHRCSSELVTQGVRDETARPAFAKTSRRPR